MLKRVIANVNDYRVPISKMYKQYRCLKEYRVHDERLEGIAATWNEENNNLYLGSQR